MGSEVYVIWEKDGGTLMQSIPRQQNRTNAELDSKLVNPHKIRVLRFICDHLVTITPY